MNKYPGILGQKLGMTQVFTDDGSLLACTVVQAGCVVVGKRTQEKDGYDALVLGVGDRKEKHLNRAQAGAYKKAGQAPRRYVRELRAAADHVAKFELGQELKVEELFSEGQLVDVQGISRGKGFQGVMKRHKFKGAVNTHGTHEWRRHGGSIGTNMTPGRVKLGQKMSGQMGNVTVSVLNVRVAKIIPEQQLILLEGGVPGAPGAVVRVQGAIKKRGGVRKA